MVFYEKNVVIEAVRDELGAGAGAGSFRACPGELKGETYLVVTFSPFQVEPHPVVYVFEESDMKDAWPSWYDSK